jgi:hypothetical protein
MMTIDAPSGAAGTLEEGTEEAKAVSMNAPDL